MRVEESETDWLTCWEIMGARGCSGSGEGIRFWDRSNLKGQKTVAVPARTGSLHARTHTGGMFQLLLMAIGIREMKGNNGQIPRAPPP
jgi:hypothetical protein